MQRFDFKQISKFFTLSALSLWFFRATPVLAQLTVDWTEGGACVSGGSEDSAGVPTIQGLQCLFGNLFAVAIPAIGFIIFIMLIVGGFRFLMSGGNAKGVESGRKTITSAIIGLVIALSAFVILNIIAEFTGISSIINFAIPSSDSGL